MLENLDAFLQDFGVTATDSSSNSFLILFDQFHSQMDISIEGRALIATAKSEDVTDFNHGSELTIEDKIYEIVGIRPLDDGKFTELDLKE